jgi:uncharacterized membrane protein YesL
MKKSFEHITNSWLYRVSKMIGDIVIMSLLFLVCCLPVVTIGASASALYFTVYCKYQKRSDSLSKDFMRSFKENLKNGIIIHMLYLIYGAVAGFNIWFAFNGLGDIKLPDWYLLVSFLPLLPVVFTLPFVYALLARFKNGIKGTLMNSFTLCMMSFPKFILILLIAAAAIAISIFFPPSALITPVAATYLIQMLTEKVFDAAMRVEKAREESNEETQSEDTDPEESDIEDDYDEVEEVG